MSQSGEVAALQALVDVLRDQLAKAEERAAEDRQQARVERDRAVAADNQARELKHLLDAEIAAVRASLVAVRKAPKLLSDHQKDKPAPARRPFWQRWLGTKADDLP